MAAGAHVLGSCRKQGEQEGSTGHRQGNKRAAPFAAVVEVGRNAGRVKPFGPQEEHQSKKKTGETRAGSPGKKGRESAGVVAVKKILHAEHGEGNGEDLATGLGKAFHGRVRGHGKHTEHCEIEKIDSFRAPQRIIGEQRGHGSLAFAPPARQHPAEGIKKGTSAVQRLLKGVYPGLGA